MKCVSCGLAPTSFGRDTHTTAVFKGALTGTDFLWNPLQSRCRRVSVHAATEKPHFALPLAPNHTRVLEVALEISGE